MTVLFLQVLIDEEASRVFGDIGVYPVYRQIYDRRGTNESY